MWVRLGHPGLLLPLVWRYHHLQQCRILLLSSVLGIHLHEQLRSRHSPGPCPVPFSPGPTCPWFPVPPHVWYPVPFSGPVIYLLVFYPFVVQLVAGEFTPLFFIMAVTSCVSSQSRAQSPAHVPASTSDISHSSFESQSPLDCPSVVLDSDFIPLAFSFGSSVPGWFPCPSPFFSGEGPSFLA